MAFIPWALAFARSRPGSSAHRTLFDVGISFIATSVAGAIATLRSTAGAPVSSPEESPPPPRVDALAVARPIGPDARARWADATLRALLAIGLADDRRDGPDLAVIRVGAAGIEVLLNEPFSDAPAPFRSSAGGLVWSLDPSVELETLIELQHGFPLSADGDPAPLVEIGSDEEGGYFAQAGNVATLHLDDELGELSDESPSFVAGEPGPTRPRRGRGAGRILRTGRSAGRWHRGRCRR